jgi:hypothetical protein
MYLHIRVLEAKELPSMDPNGLADPYCRMYMNDKKKEIVKTRTIEKTLTPVWNESFTFLVRDTLPGTTLHITLYDQDLLDASKISQLDFPYQQLPPGKVVDQWLDMQPAKSGRSGGRLHLIFHLARSNREPPFVETAQPEAAPVSVLTPKVSMTDVTGEKSPPSRYAEYDLSIVVFIKDELHPEIDGQRVADTLQRVAKDKKFKSINILPISSKVADLDAVYEKVPPGPKSIVLLVLSNNSTKHFKLLQIAINNTNFVIPDLDGVRLAQQKIIPELELGETIVNPINFEPIVQQLAPKVGIGKDADLFLANYLYAKGIRKIGRGVGSVVRFSTPSVVWVPVREQVKFTMAIVDYIVDHLK